MPSLILAHQPSRCYYCTIVKDRVWLDSMGFCVLRRNVSRPIRLQEQVMWLINHFDRGPKVGNVLLVALPLVQTSSNLLETWPRGVGTAKHEGHATRDRKHLINVFYSEAVSGGSGGNCTRLSS